MVGENIDGPAIELANLSFDWPGGKFGLSVPDFRVARGQSVLLIGPSGSGKSTLLSLICGLVLPSDGDIRVDGTDLRQLTGAQRDRFRAETIGLVFQMFNLLPYASGVDNILIPLRFSPKRRAKCKDGRTEAVRLSRALGLSEHMVRGAPASSLSVGQQQRVAVARALIGTPPILIADEPTSALDRNAQDEFLDLVFAQVRKAATTLLMVSHDESLGARFDRVVRLADIGQIRAVAAA